MKEMKIIKFEKEDCNPCLSVSKKMESLGLEYEAIKPFDHPEMATKFKLRTVPTVILLEDGQEIKRIIGYKPEELEQLKEIIETRKEKTTGTCR